MNLVGVVICNFNKREYVINCIKSVLESSFQSMDIYVVDNASTDDSVEFIKKEYGNKVTLIVNKQNLGGSGGFNTGLKKALENNYKYLMCVDNDIVMEKNNIENLYKFMETNLDVGMVGSKICRMNKPELLQELGAQINFEKFNVKPHFQDFLDDNQIPEIMYCDYVPACSLMVRTSAVREVGILPEANFIYWDDMEWGYCFNLKGYKVAAYSRAIVYHAMGTTSGETYFSTYYFWRNRIRFFMKYTPKDKLDNMKRVILENFFQTIYGCLYKEKFNQIKIMMYAFDDAIHGKLGKAGQHKILAKDILINRINELLLDKEKILIDFNGDYKALADIIKQLPEGKKVNIYYNGDCRSLQKLYINCKVINENKADNWDVYLKMCEHVSNIEDISLKMIYIDRYNNLLVNEKDINHFKNYKYNFNLFYHCYVTLLDESIRSMRCEN